MATPRAAAIAAPPPGHKSRQHASPVGGSGNSIPVRDGHVATSSRGEQRPQVAAWTTTTSSSTTTTSTSTSSSSHLTVRVTRRRSLEWMWTMALVLSTAFAFACFVLADLARGGLGTSNGRAVSFLNSLNSVASFRRQRRVLRSPSSDCAQASSPNTEKRRSEALYLRSSRHSLTHRIKLFSLVFLAKFGSQSLGSLMIGATPVILKGPRHMASWLLAFACVQLCPRDSVYRKLQDHVSLLLVTRVGCALYKLRKFNFVAEFALSRQDDLSYLWMLTALVVVIDGNNLCSRVSTWGWLRGYRRTSTSDLFFAVVALLRRVVPIGLAASLVTCSACRAERRRLLLAEHFSAAAAAGGPLRGEEEHHHGRSSSTTPLSSPAGLPQDTSHSDQDQQHHTAAAAAQTMLSDATSLAAAAGVAAAAARASPGGGQQTPQTPPSVSVLVKLVVFAVFLARYDVHTLAVKAAKAAARAFGPSDDFDAFSRSGACDDDAVRRRRRLVGRRGHHPPYRSADADTNKSAWTTTSSSSSSSQPTTRSPLPRSSSWQHLAAGGLSGGRAKAD